VRKLYNDNNPDQVYIAWDSRLIKGVKNFRRLDSEEYKNNRDKENWKKVYEKEKEIRKAITYLGMKNIHPGVLEADDVISFLCEGLPGVKTIVTSDHDMLQLISRHVSVYNPMKKQMYNVNNFSSFFPVDVDQYIQYKALIGDKSDNILGIPGVGPKRAIKLLERGVENLEPAHRKIFEDNIMMVDLKEGFKQHPEEIQLYKSQIELLVDLKPHPSEFSALCKEHGVEHENLYSVFFKDAINNVVLDLLS
jgi:DNA polymerase-1